jgi:hypothetical protein
LVQAQALGTLRGGRWAIRELVSKQAELRRYEPSEADGRLWQDAEARLATGQTSPGSNGRRS